MSEQILTIETTVKIDTKPITEKPFSRDIKAHDAHANTVTVPKDAPGCKQCFLV